MSTIQKQMDLVLKELRLYHANITPRIPGLERITDSCLCGSIWQFVDPTERRQLLRVLGRHPVDMKQQHVFGCTDLVVLILSFLPPGGVLTARACSKALWWGAPGAIRATLGRVCGAGADLAALMGHVSRVEVSRRPRRPNYNGDNEPVEAHTLVYAHCELAMAVAGLQNSHLPIDILMRVESTIGPSLGAGQLARAPDGPFDLVMRPRSGVSLKIATLEGFFAQLRLRLRTEQNCVYGYAVGVESADAAYLRSIGGQFNPANRAYVFGLISRGRILVQILQIRPDGVLIETTGLLVATEAVEAAATTSTAATSTSAAVATSTAVPWPLKASVICPELCRPLESIGWHPGYYAPPQLPLRWRRESRSGLVGPIGMVPLVHCNPLHLIRSVCICLGVENPIVCCAFPYEQFRMGTHLPPARVVVVTNLLPDVPSPVAPTGAAAPLAPAGDAAPDEVVVEFSDSPLATYSSPTATDTSAAADTSAAIIAGLLHSSKG